MTQPTKKLGEISTGIIFVIFAFAFYVKGQYWQSLILVFLLIILLRLDYLKKFTLDLKKGIDAEFEIPKEKIEQDIKENNKLVNKKNFVAFKEIEERVLRHIQSKVGGSMKRQIHYVFGCPPDFEFTYTPDATLQTVKELIFVEIKYVSHINYVDQIINNGIEQLNRVLQKLGPSSGKKLVAKLVLTSDFFIDLSKYKKFKDIELIYYPL